MSDFTVDGSDPRFAIAPNGARVELGVAQQIAAASGGTVAPASVDFRATEAPPDPPQPEPAPNAFSFVEGAPDTVGGPPTQPAPPQVNPRLHAAMHGSAPDAAAGEQIDLASLRASAQPSQPAPVSRPRIATVQGPTTTQQQLLGPGEGEAIAGQLALIEQMRPDLEEQALRQREANQTAADVAAQRAQIANDAAESEAARQAEKDRAVDAELGKLKEIRDDIMGAEIDPNRAWTRLDTGSKILTGIGVLLGGIGSGFTGGPNQALSIVERALDRDLEAQKKAMDLKIQGGRFQESIYSKVRERFADEDQATLAARLLQYDALDSELAKAQARASVPSQQEALRLARAEMDAKALGIKQELGQSLRSTVTSQQRHVVVGGAPALGTKDSRLQRPDGGLPGFSVDDPEAFAQVASDDVSYRQLRAAVEGAALLQDAIGTMKRLRRTHGTEWGSKEAAEYQAAKGNLIGAVNANLREAGVVNENEYTRLDDEIPSLGPRASDALRVFGSDVTMNKLEGLERALMGQVNAKLRTWGGSLQGTRRKPAAADDARLSAQGVVR